MSRYDTFEDALTLAYIAAGQGNEIYVKFVGESVVYSGAVDLIRTLQDGTPAEQDIAVAMAECFRIIDELGRSPVRLFYEPEWAAGVKKLYMWYDEYQRLVQITDTEGVAV